MYASMGPRQFLIQKKDRKMRARITWVLACSFLAALAGCTSAEDRLVLEKIATLKKIGDVMERIAENPGQPRQEDIKLKKDLEQKLGDLNGRLDALGKEKKDLACKKYDSELRAEFDRINVIKKGTIPK
jgi:TolA-binding protein